MRIAAYFLSYMFHPLIIPTLGLLIFFNTDSYINYAIPKDLKQAIILIIFITTFIMPVIATLLLLNRKLISSLEMDNRKERFLPYASTLLFYVFTIYLINQTGIPPFINKFLLGATVAIALALAINFKWKISAHMISIGGLLGAIMAMTFILELQLLPYIILFIFISGLLATSRLVLNAHTPAQIFAGFVLGLATQLMAILLY